MRAVVFKTAFSTLLRWPAICTISRDIQVRGGAMHRKFIFTASTLAIGLIAASARAADVSALLNKANAINYEEVQAAKTATSKAGDNQALLTFAATVKGDHEANEDAVSALARQKNVKLEG